MLFYVIILPGCKKHVQSYKKSAGRQGYKAAGTVSDSENGNTQIPPKVLIALSVFYDTSVDYLLDLTDVKEPYPKGGKERQRTQEEH